MDIASVSYYLSVRETACMVHARGCPNIAEYTTHSCMRVRTSYANPQAASPSPVELEIMI